MGGDFPLDRSYRSYAAITGIDEAGRGCLAGPVVIASVTLSIRDIESRSWFQLLADSKTLTAETREILYPKILLHGSRIRIAVIGPILIDYLNILRATLHGFEMVAPPPDPKTPLLIDGNQKPPSLKWALTVVKGDQISSAMAAAGILAKVTRDRLMQRLDRQFPGYGFGRHKGYATAAHRKALDRLGSCPYHRKSFRPVGERLGESCSQDAALLHTWPNEKNQLIRKWRGFQTSYQLYSLTASRIAVRRFHEMGLGLLPTSDEPLAYLGNARF